MMLTYPNTYFLMRTWKQCKKISVLHLSGITVQFIFNINMKWTVSEIRQKKMTSLRYLLKTHVMLSISHARLFTISHSKLCNSVKGTASTNVSLVLSYRPMLQYCIASTCVTFTKNHLNRLIVLIVCVTQEIMAKNLRL